MQDAQGLQVQVQGGLRQDQAEVYDLRAWCAFRASGSMQTGREDANNTGIAEASEGYLGDDDKSAAYSDRGSRAGDVRASRPGSSRWKSRSEHGEKDTLSPEAEPGVVVQLAAPQGQ